MESRSNFIARVRGFEQRLQAHMDEIFCPVHLSLGHERVAADIWECIGSEDWLFSTHRNHHHYFAKGGDEQRLWDEILGLPSGLNAGFAGSQSITDAALRFHSSAIVGGMVGVATGVAQALKMDLSRNIAVCCIGDAGTEQGVFWEALNFAVLHMLPIAFICENNGKSVDATIIERQAMPIALRVNAFGVSVQPTVALAIQGARLGIPSVTEQTVVLEADHLNMSTLMPSLGLR